MPDPDAPAFPAGHTAGVDTDHGWDPVPRFLIRSAGFPFDTVDCGGDTVTAVLKRRAEVHSRLDALLERWPERFDEALRGLERRSADRASFKQLYKARREVVQCRRVPDEAAGYLDSAWLRDWHRLLDSLDSAEQRLDEAVRNGITRGRIRLRQLLEDDRFGTALGISNPGAAQRLRRSLPADPDGRRSATRQDERTVYAYAQRFATKNETVSFFGPVDYGLLRPKGRGPAEAERSEPDPPVRLQYASGPWQARTVRLAHWAVQAIADQVAQDPDIAGQLPLRPRDGSTLSADGTLLIATTGKRVTLSRARAAVLRKVTAESRTRDALALELDEPGPLLELLSRGVLTCRLLVPTALDDPAAWLHKLLAGIEGAGERSTAAGAGSATRSLTRAAAAAARWSRVLETLARGADALPGGTGDGGAARALPPVPSPNAERPIDPSEETGSVRRAELLATLEQEFVEATAEPARRGAGNHYADRLLVTEDCRGPVEQCVIPPGQTAALTDRLAPVLGLCASYSLLVQEAVHARALEVHARLAREGGPVAYLRLLAELDAAAPVEEAMADPAPARWLARFDALVRAGTQQDVVRLDPGQLEPLTTGLPAGLLVSPDIFLCDDPTVTPPGQVGLVVGEIHHGAQVWTHLSALDPAPADTERQVAAAAGNGGELATLICRRTQGKAFERELPGPAVLFRSASARSHSVLHQAEDLTVGVSHGRLLLTTTDGSPVRLHTRHPRSAGNWLFGPPPVITPAPLAGAPYAPRILVGDVVAWRRRWRFDADGLEALTRPQQPGQLVRSAAELQQRLGLPRLVFARSRSARKPVFADLNCPTSLPHLAHYLRGASGAELTEMLPEPGQWWLRSQGRPVSCEWRLTFSWTGTNPAGVGAASVAAAAGTAPAASFTTNRSEAHV